MVLFLIPLSSYSQIHKALNIGDSIPLITFRNIFNKPGNTLSLSDFSGKLIIFDFWNVWCASCILAFPKMEKLQQEFGDKIKVLLVTNNSDEEIKRLFKRIKSPDLPIISNDRILNTLFPHVSVPHHVWINPDGHVQFITDGYNASSANVTKVLERRNFNLHVKNEAIDFERDSALWKEGHGRLQKYINSYSYSMTKIEEYGPTIMDIIKDSANKTIGFKFINASLKDMYKIAFGGSVITSNTDFYYENRILYKIPGGNKTFKFPSNPDSIPKWEKKNIFCYESKWKLNNEKQAYQYLQNDVNRFFPYSVNVKEKDVMCYLLKRVSDSEPIKTLNGKKEFVYTDSLFRIKNLPVSVFLKSLNGLKIFESMPVIDETNCSTNIDVSLINAFGSIASLKKELLRNGFRLEQGKKKISMLIINEKQ